MEREKGFTLVELAAVIAVVGLLSVLAVPPVLAWRTNTVLHGNARMLAADLQRAKAHAVKLNCPVVVSLSAASYTVFIDDGSGGATAGDWQQTGEEVLIGKRSFSEGVVFQHNFSANRLRFSGSGGNKTGTAKFLNADGKQLTVVLSLLGRVRIK